MILSALIIGAISPCLVADDSAYNSIINSYIDCYESKGANIGSLPADANFMKFDVYNSNRPLNYYGYKLYDINKDGINELLVGANLHYSGRSLIQDSFGNPTIEAIFTLKDNTPKFLYSSINREAPVGDFSDDFNYIRILKDNRIASLGNYNPYKPGNDLSDRYNFYNLDSNGNLNLQESYIVDSKSGIVSEVYSIVNSQEKEISYQELNGILDRTWNQFLDYDPIPFSVRNPIKGNENSSIQPSQPSENAGSSRSIYRLYNKNSGEHLYTSDVNENIIF